MTAEQFAPGDLEALVRAAVTLWENVEVTDLPEEQQNALARARDAVLAEHTGRPLQEWLALCPAAAGSTVWLLRRWDRHGDVLTAYGDEESVYHDLAAYVDQCWSDIRERENLPPQPPADPREAVALYYGDGRPDEGYDLTQQAQLITLCPSGSPRG